MSKREDILSRIRSLLAQVSFNGVDPIGDENVYRDRGSLPKEKRPGLILLDGNAHRVGPEQRSGRSMLPGPQVMALEPQIFGELKVRPVDEASDITTGIGPELSNLEIEIYKVITNDNYLISLLTPPGIGYRGCVTDMQSGSAMEGSIQMLFSFFYVLDPRKL